MTIRTTKLKCSLPLLQHNQCSKIFFYGWMELYKFTIDLWGTINNCLNIKIYLMVIKKQTTNANGSLINSLRPSDAYMHQLNYQHWSRKWLVAWSAPSHYRNQWWNIINWNLKNKLQWNFKQNSYIFIQDNAFENVVWKMVAILSQPQCVLNSITTLSKWNSTKMKNAMIFPEAFISLTV